MLSYILQVTVCLSAFYLLYLLFLSRETFFAINRWYLLGTLVLSLLLPFLPAVFTTPVEPTLMTYTIEPVAISIRNASTALETTSSGPSWLTVLLAGYWIVVAVLFMKFITGLHAIYRCYLNKVTIQNLGRRRIVSSRDVNTPFSFFHWIFLPEQHELTSDELSEIIKHESAHAAALHSIDVLLMELACIVIWPSPFIYLYRRSLRRVHEYLADATVLEGTPLHKYGSLLLSQSAKGMQMALTNHFFQNQLKHRIMMMTKNRSRKRALLKYAIVVPVVLLAGMLVAFRDMDNAGHNADNFLPALNDTIPENDQVFKVVEEMPRFPGCEDSGLVGMELRDCAQRAMLEYVYKNITYPVEARNHGIQGRLVVQFVVRKDGTISDAKVIRSLGYGIDEEALKVVESMPKWRPGYSQGEAVNVQFTLPVQYKLETLPPAADEKDKKDVDVVVTSTQKEKTVSSADQNEVYTVVEEMPRFPGCEGSGLSGQELEQCANKKLFEFVGYNINYPEEARKAGVEGKVLVRFIVHKNGQVSDPEIIQSLGHGTDEAVIDMIKAMPDWRPGYHKKQAVDVKMVLPVNFILPADSPENSDGQNALKPGFFNLEMYPVPLNGKLYYSVYLPQGQNNLTIELLTPAGQVIKRESKELDQQDYKKYASNLDVGELAPGTYAVRVIWGDAAETRLVVVK